MPFGHPKTRSKSSIVALSTSLREGSGQHSEKLHRPIDAPLDPAAVATFGAYLFTYGLRDDVKESVIKQIQESEEYRSVHG